MWAGFHIGWATHFLGGFVPQSFVILVFGMHRYFLFPESSWEYTNYLSGFCNQEVELDSKEHNRDFSLVQGAHDKKKK